MPIPFDFEQHLFFWLTQVMSRRDRQLTLALRPHGLRVSDWRVLGPLYCRRGLTMSEVADVAAIDQTTLSRTVPQLERAGLLMRLTDVADKRVTRLALTAAGTKLIVAILPLVFRLNDHAVRNLPPAMVELLRWALQEMRRNLEAGLPAAERPKAAAHT
ncbi:MAG: MarR family winged helix-turn-helix transcriptional regulator [Alphaproteobacteria bacterium]